MHQSTAVHRGTPGVHVDRRSRISLSSPYLQHQRDDECRQSKQATSPDGSAEIEILSFFVVSAWGGPSAIPLFDFAMSEKRKKMRTKKVSSAGARDLNVPAHDYTPASIATHLAALGQADGIKFFQFSFLDLFGVQRCATHPLV